MTTTDFADTTSEPETDYYYWIVAVCANGESEVSASAHLPGWTLNVPTDVLASDGTDTTGVQINWTAVPNATSYQILRDGESVGTSSSNEYFDKSAVMGMRYKYSVKSCAGTHSSTASGEDAGWPRLNLTGKYVVIDISGGTNAWFYPVMQVDSEPSDGWTNYIDKVVLRRIEPGAFMMGDPSCDVTYTGHHWTGSDYAYWSAIWYIKSKDNYDYHRVTLTKAFYIGVVKMTEYQINQTVAASKSWSYALSHGSLNPSNSTPCVLPTTYGGSILSGLAMKSGITTGNLPTDAEWEYACRAGTTSKFNTGDSVFDANRPRNNWGLYDMHTGYKEWRRDEYQHHLGVELVVDPCIETAEEYDDPKPSSTCSVTYGRCCKVLRGGDKAYGYNGSDDKDENRASYFRDNTRCWGPVGNRYSWYRPFCYAGEQ